MSLLTEGVFYFSTSVTTPLTAVPHHQKTMAEENQRRGKGWPVMELLCQVITLECPVLVSVVLDS